MRKFLILFLLVLMPLQLTWAAVASYCQHETGAAAQHFSHHTHQHQGQPVDAPRADKGAASGNPSMADLDCAVCHATCAAAPLPAAAQLACPSISSWGASPYRLHHSAAPPARLERPQWQRAAA